MPAGLRSRFRDACAVLGAGRALTLSFRWLLQRDYDVFCLDLERYQAESIRKKSLKWTELEPGQVPDLVKVNPQLQANDLLQRLDKGQRCLLGWVQGKIVHYRWDCDSPSHLWFLGMDCQPLDGDIVVVDVYTCPEVRGSGIYSASAIRAALMAKELGYRRYLTFVAAWNRPPQHIWRNVLNAQQVGSIKYRPYGPGSKHRITGRIAWERPGRVYLPQPKAQENAA
jgi:GNAT superfamily N-acetyltransferase